MAITTNGKQLSPLKAAAVLGGAIAVFIGILGVLGWTLRRPFLISFGPGYIPIAISTCILFCIQGAILVLRTLRTEHARHWLVVTVVSLTAIFGISIFAGYVFNSDSNVERLLFHSEQFAQFPANRMSPFTGILFFFSGLSLLASLRNNHRKITSDFIVLLAAPAALTGTIGSMAYLYGTPLLYAGPIIPLALTTCLAFMSLGFGLIAAAGSGASMLKPLSGSSIRASLLRFFVPLGVLAAIGSNILQQAVTNLNSAIVSGISAVFWAAVTVVLVIEAARRFERILDEAETERVFAQKELLRVQQDWKRTFDSVPDLVAILDNQHRIVRMNRAMADRLGKNPEECIGRPCYEVVHGEAKAPAFCPHDSTCRDGAEHVTDVFEPRLGGHFLISTTPIHDKQGLLKGIVHVARDITRQKQAEAALQEAHNRLDAIIEFLPDATFVIDRDGKVIAWNRSMEEITGVSKADILYMGNYEYAIPFYGERRPVLIDLLLDPDPELEVGAYQCVRRDGDLLIGETFTPQAFGGRGAYVWSTASVLRNSSGEVIGAIQSIRDITERKRVEDLTRIRLNLLEFAHSHSLEELLQKTLDEVGSLTNSPIGFYHFVEEDQETLSLQAWSTRTVKEFCRAEGKGLHYGIEQAGVWVDCVRERKPVIHNDYSALSHCKGLPAGHAPVIRELVAPIIRLDRIVAILGIGNKATDYTDKDVEIVSYLADVAWEITQRKRAEEALRESEETFRSLFDEHAAVKFIIDPNTGTILNANKAAAAFYGWSRETLMQMNIRQINTLPPSEIKERMQEARDGRQTLFEFRHRLSDGSIRDVEVFSSRITTHGHVHSIIHDITERRRAEKEREKLISELQEALASVKTLKGLLPICAWCKKIRDDEGYWNKLEAYIGRHSEVSFSHGICPDCAQKVREHMDQEQKGEILP